MEKLQPRFNLVAQRGTNCNSLGLVIPVVLQWGVISEKAISVSAIAPSLSQVGFASRWQLCFFHRNAPRWDCDGVVLN